MKHRFFMSTFSHGAYRENTFQRLPLVEHVLRNARNFSDLVSFGKYSSDQRISLITQKDLSFGKASRQLASNVKVKYCLRLIV